MPSAPPAGYFGKIPARGDFVSWNLPSSTAKAWDEFVSAGMAEASTVLAETWSDIWLDAPVWRFALPEGLCGAEPLLGLWMPSIDKAGRHFPLMIAVPCPGALPEQMARHGRSWLDAAEDAGRAAIADDLPPDQLANLIPQTLDLGNSELGTLDLAACADAGLPRDVRLRPDAGLWWTEGSPHVPAQSLCLDTMPDRATFVTMVDAAHAAP